MNEREAWNVIFKEHCDNCFDGDNGNCHGEECEYAVALRALNRVYYEKKKEQNNG